MQKIRCIIIEDEEKASQLLRGMLEEFCGGIEVLAEARNVAEGVTEIKKHKPDLVFLDIEMPRASGFTLFSHFDEIDFEVIFTTAYGQYAIKAIKLAALDYLMKPIHLEELMEALNRFREKKQKESLELDASRLAMMQVNMQSANEDQKIAVPCSNGYVFVKIGEIIRCQSDKGYTLIVKNDGKEIWASKGLVEYDAILTDFGFVRVHRSHLVNPKYIERFIKGKSPVLEMQDGAEISVSANKRDNLMKLFLKP